MAMEQRSTEMENVDRLSRLPDGPLHNIMSFLTAKQAVKTCILSKRWKNVWRHIPCLKFNYSEFSSAPEFIQFVRSFLNLRAATYIDAFQLDWSDMNPTFTRRWNIELHLPLSFIRRASFESMELYTLMVPRKNQIGPVNLQLLSLIWVRLDNECIQTITRSCPMLKDLIINKCWFLSSSISITSSSLKTLSIDYSHNRNSFQLCISSPCLVSLDVMHVVLNKFSLEEMPSLVKACVHFDYKCDERNLRSCNQLLRGLSNATYLELIGTWLWRCDKRVGSITESSVTDFLQKELSNFPAFDNLKHLYLGGWDACNGFGPLALFIHLSPDLETLTLQHKQWSYGNSRIECNLRSAICCEHLKSVSVKCPKPDEKVVEELKDTLKATIPGLEKIDVIYSFGYPFGKT